MTRNRLMLILLSAVALMAVAVTPQVLQLYSSGTRVARVYGVNCGANMVCTESSGVWQVSSTGGGATGPTGPTGATGPTGPATASTVWVGGACWWVNP